MTAAATNVHTDDHMLRHIEAKLNAPDYVPELVPAAQIARAFHVSRQAVTNWGARTDRTGVHRRRGGYDRNEVFRWMLIRDHDRAARRSKHLTST